MKSVNNRLAHLLEGMLKSISKIVTGKRVFSLDALRFAAIVLGIFLLHFFQTNTENNEDGSTNGKWRTIRKISKNQPLKGNNQITEIKSDDSSTMDNSDSLQEGHRP
jgi:hypothetical protein